MVISDAKGNILVRFIEGSEDELVTDPRYRPLTSSLVVVRGDSGFMLLHNKYRSEWELPGGLIDPGETPRECAERECFEESGFRVTGLRFAGLMEFDLSPDWNHAERRSEFSALYCAEAPAGAVFEENDEMSGMIWHKSGDFVENANLIDLKLFDYYR